MRIRALSGSWTGYVLAALGITSAFFVRRMLVQHFGELPAYVIFFPVVFLVAAFGGVGPGLFATALASYVIDGWILRSRGHFWVASRADVVGLLIFLFYCTAISIGSGFYRRARQRQRESEIARREADLAQRKATDQALRESEERFRQSIDAGSLGTWVHHIDIDSLECDERSRQHFGVSSDGPLSQVLDRVHPDDRLPLTKAIAAAWDPVHADGRYGEEYRMVHNNGAVRWLRVEARVLFEGAGDSRHAVRVVGTTQDITPRRTADQALHASEQRLRLAYDAASAGAWEWDPRTDRTVWSEQAWKLHGLPPSDGNPTRQMWHAVVHPDDIEAAERIITDAQQAQREFTAEWRVRDPVTGSYRWLLARGRPMRDDAGHVKLYSGIVLDITDRRRAEQALRDSETRLNNVIENLAEGLIVANPDGSIMSLQWNRAALLMHGYASREEVQRPLKEVIAEFELLPVEGGSPLPYEQWPIPRLMRGEIVRGLELRFRRSDKKLDRIYSYGGTTVRNTAGQLQFVLLTITDITAHAQAQISLRQAKEHAESTGRAKDHFLAVVSHELRTPLTPVLAATTGLQARTDLPADVGDELQMIRRNVELEARLVDDLLTLTRLHRGKIFLHQETVDVSAIIRTAIDQSQDEIETKRLELKVDADGGESVIWADPTRFQQSVSNLLSNAVKFTPDKGTISIHTTSAGGKFRLEVSDTGVGIEPDVLARLFNPFEQGEQTVTRKFGGLGLGLSIAKQFIELHGGTLTAASDGPGRGARFTIELDAVAIGPIDLKAPAPPASIGARPAKASSKKQSVLLVEDHPDTARILARLLKSIGYSVTTAGTVAEALALADGHRFDFLLSDIGLPDGSGCEIARELCSRKLVARALALSGFGQPEDIARSLEAGFADHLIKPINFEKLRDVLASLATPSK